MTDSIPPEKRLNPEQWLAASQERLRLIEQQAKLINRMLLSQDEFMKAMQENAEAMAKAAPK